MSEIHWEVVGAVAGDMQAEILKGLLEAQGIEVFLSREGAGRAYGLGVGELGTVQILVPSVQLNAAQQVLDDYEAGKFESTELELGESDTPEEDEE